MLAATTAPQDFILHEILRQMTQSRADGSAQYLTEAIFPDIDAISHEHLQTLLRFLSGMADFARWNSHESRWKKFPGLRDDVELKRFCLFCKIRGEKVLDTEWHALFECPTCRGPRSQFRLALRSHPELVTFPILKRTREPTVSDLATLVIRCRKDERLICDLARFVVDSLSLRQQAFRKLSVRDLLPVL